MVETTADESLSSYTYKVQRFGGSLAVVLPEDFCSLSDIQKGDTLIATWKHGIIQYTRPQVEMYDLSE